MKTSSAHDLSGFPPVTSFFIPAQASTVAPVTRGERLASFGWVQSLVRDDTDRTLLFELDVAIEQMDEGKAAHASQLPFSNIYNNLLRRWADI